MVLVPIYSCVPSAGCRLSVPFRQGVFGDLLPFLWFLPVCHWVLVLFSDLVTSVLGVSGCFFLFLFLAFSISLRFFLLIVFRFCQLVDFFCSFSVSDGVPSVSAVCFSRFSIFVCRSVIRSCCAMILASWLCIWDCLSLFSFSTFCSFFVVFSSALSCWVSFVCVCCLTGVACCSLFGLGHSEFGVSLLPLWIFP